MAAPSPVTRTAPTQPKLENGFVWKIGFSQDVDISLYEVSLNPPGLDGGDPIDVTTQWSVALREKALRGLIDIPDFTFTCGYNPIVHSQLIAIINDNGAISIDWPNGDKLTFYGALRVAEYDALEEGTFPMITCTVTVTNRDPINKVQAAPVFTEGAGTG